MKKILLFIGITFAFIATSCNPLEDTYEELEEQNAENNIIQGEASFTLTEEDYEELEKSYNNFDSDDEAKELIADLLASKYPVWGEGSIATVSYKLYAPASTESSLIIYEPTDADIDNYGTSYGNFDDQDQLIELVENVFPDADNRTLVSLTYEYYDGGLSTVNNGFLKVNGEWIFIQGITDDEYTSLDESYPNFSSEDEALVKIPFLLNEKYKYETPDENTIVQMMYKLYVSGSTDSFVVNYIYQNGAWIEYENELTNTIQFGYKSGVWVPDNTIKYTITDADAVTIGNNFLTTDGFENAADNLAYFTSFERREADTEYWSDDMLIEAFGWFLDNNLHPDAEEGQQYVITFVTYTGAYSTEDIKLIKTDGSWVLNVDEAE